jgi:hypothetical protein
MSALSASNAVPVMLMQQLVRMLPAQAYGPITKSRSNHVAIDRSTNINVTELE